MCGRYSLTTPVDGLRRLFGFDRIPNLPARYNIAPTQAVLAVRAEGDLVWESTEAIRVATDGRGRISRLLDSCEWRS